MIKRHFGSLFLEFKEARSDKAATLHSVTRDDRQESARLKLQAVDKSFAIVSGGDFGQRTVRQADGYESTLTQEPRAFNRGKCQVYQAAGRG